MGLSYLEDFDSVIPAVQVLQRPGVRSQPKEALRLRNGRVDQVILTGVSNLGWKPITGLKPRREAPVQRGQPGRGHPAG